MILLIYLSTLTFKRSSHMFVLSHSFSFKKFLSFCFITTFMLLFTPLPSPKKIEFKFLFSKSDLFKRLFKRIECQSTRTTRIFPLPLPSSDLSAPRTDSNAHKRTYTNARILIVIAKRHIRKEAIFNA